MIVDHVVASIENQSSGPSQSVPAMCRGLAHSGVDVQLNVLDTTSINDPSYRIACHKCCRLPFPRLGRSPALLRTLKERAVVADIIHDHGLWQMPNIYCGRVCRNATCKLVCSPRGCLSAYSMRRSHWKKAIMLRMGQASMMSRVDMFHATSEMEAGDIRRLGYVQPIVILPNGIEMPHVITGCKPSKKSGTKTLIYLSRIHPEKRIEDLIEAWRVVSLRHLEWRLLVYGSLSGDYPRRILESSKGLPRIEFRGEIRDDPKFRAYREADLFVLPTRTENFGMAIAEALACGTPAITTKGAPWSGLPSHGAGCWIENGVAPLVDALDSAMSLSVEELSEMGARGRAWMQRDFDWDNLGEKMRLAYEWLVHRKEKPAWVFER